LRPGTLRISRLYLTGPYFRPLHTVSLAAISRADLAARLSIIARDHGPGATRAARRSASALFPWAMEEGWVESNPIIGTRKVAPVARDRVLSNTELAAIWNAASDDALGEYGAIVRLLILTGARRQEVGGMCRSELDLAAGTWTLPAARSKNHRAHTIVLPA